MASLRDFDPNESVFWKLDRQEDRWRRRRRLVRNYNGTTHPEATIGGRPMSPSIETPSTRGGVDLSLAATAVKFAAHVDHFDSPVTEGEIEDIGMRKISFFFFLLSSDLL
jgi:hypothetical protein